MDVYQPSADLSLLFTLSKFLPPHLRRFCAGRFGRGEVRLLLPAPRTLRAGVKPTEWETDTGDRTGRRKRSPGRKAKRRRRSARLVGLVAAGGKGRTGRATLHPIWFMQSVHCPHRKPEQDETPGGAQFAIRPAAESRSLESRTGTFWLPVRTNSLGHPEGRRDGSRSAVSNG